MIEKSRLEELIEQGATIWCPYYMFYEGGIQLDNKDYIDGEILYVVNEVWKDNFRKQPLKLEYLFETKEDAEEYLEFGNITRTETLKLPKWEEFLKDNFGIRFYYKSRGFHLHKVRHSADDNNPQWKINIYEDYGDDYDTVAWEKEWDLTKDNYIEARKLAKKLFLGEVEE